MAAMVVQKLLEAGTNPVLSAANLTDTAPVNDGHSNILIVKNGSGSSVTVTLADFLSDDAGDANPSHVVTVAAAATAYIPLHQSYDKGDGTGAQITYSAVTTVTSAVLKGSF
jgi:hypothetical protein